MSTDDAATGTREEFARAMLTPRSSARVDFMARFGVEWLDPTADRKLLERLLTFPLHIFRAGNRPRGLARELGHGRLPQSVRLRRTRAPLITEQTAWFVQRSADYARALQGLRDSTVCTEFLDLASLSAVLETLCAGSGTTAQAATLHRALDAGLFAAALESRHGIGASPTPTLFESVADMRRISAAR
jgi:asparagine synthase (glutamine-hydrolysing)